MKKWKLDYTVLKYFKRFLLYITIYTAALAVLFPILLMIVISFKPSAQLINPSLIPDPPILDHYKWVINETSFLINLKNSMLLSILVTVVSLLIGSPIAYSIARFRYPGRFAISQVVLFAYLVPNILLLVPIFIMLSKMGLLDSIGGLVLADTAFVLPFCLTLLTGFFEAIPIEIEEAAFIDGCTKLGAFRHILLPLTLPGLVTSAMFAWLLSWNEFLFALTFLSSDEVKTLPVRMNWYLGSNVGAERWGAMQAEAVMYAAPAFLLFLFLQKYLAEGITAGAVKG